MIPVFLFLYDWPWYRSPRMAMDIWKEHISAATTLLSQTTLIHDRFHLIQYLNKAINPVRRREVKSHGEFKGSRYVLLKNEKIGRKNRTKSSKLFRNPVSRSASLGGYAESLKPSLGFTRTPKRVPTSSCGLKA